jgi:hypothetical protein
VTAQPSPLTLPASSNWRPAWTSKEMPTWRFRIAPLGVICGITCRTSTATYVAAAVASGFTAGDMILGAWVWFRFLLTRATFAKERVGKASDMRRIVYLLVLTAAAPTQAHEPDLYDAMCCHARDCAPISSSDVTLVPGGYEVHGVVIAEESPRKYWSRDGRFHLCTAPYRLPAETHNIRCLYVPRGES